MNTVRLSLGVVASFALLLVVGCKHEDTAAHGLVAEASVTAAPADAGATTVDPSQCGGCQLAAQTSWTFEGIYRDDHCTDPLAQTVLPACTVVPTLGQTTITYVDEIQARKAGTSASVALAEVAPTAMRYRKAGTVCVRANEGATAFTPAGCGGQRACRDANGTVACTGCRSIVGGCPDYEETRLYASITDPLLKAVHGGGDSLGKLQQCCNAIAAEAKRQGNAPELVAAATQCHLLVSAAGPNGNAPELASIRALLAGRNLPAVCAGL